MRIVANIARGLFIALSVISLAVSGVATAATSNADSKNAPVVAIAAAVAGVAWAMLALASAYGFGEPRTVIQTTPPTYGHSPQHPQGYGPQPAHPGQQPYR